jgi:hypothetical protein
MVLEIAQFEIKPGMEVVCRAEQNQATRAAEL